ncbi:hypothetical protein H9Q74_000017 [Fusarium xylarioides]|nr:hypothetical protein H9Q71_000167 [Fusarium xylarioides]KAG5829864.1 hypothetical protein H9Q74_000017 [Fusarium xylarioides]
MSHENSKSFDDGDIRKEYQPTGRDADVVASILETRPPRYVTPVKHCGFPCLITVMRRINSHMMLAPNGLVRSQSWRQAENNNPIISHSWQMFGPERGARELSHRSFGDITKTLPSLGVDPSASFYKLCTSSLMNQTYWSRDELRLFEPKVCLETWELVGEEPNEIAESSVVRLNLAQHPATTLQRAVEDSLGIIDRQGKPTLHRPGRPCIVRVLLDTSPENQLPFDCLRAFQLPIWKETGNREVPFDTTKSALYVVLAVVRMESGASDRDQVRIYASQGPEIVPEYEDVPYMSTGWSVEDKVQQSYMLFFGTAPAGMEELHSILGVPEVLQPALPADDMPQMRHCLSVLDPHIRTASGRSTDTSSRAKRLEPGELLDTQHANRQSSSAGDARNTRTNQPHSRGQRRPRAPSDGEDRRTSGQEPKRPRRDVNTSHLSEHSRESDGDSRRTSMRQDHAQQRHETGHRAQLRRGPGSNRAPGRNNNRSRRRNGEESRDNRRS